MSADDFRDLVTEFDHSGVCDLEFYRWTAPTFAYGDIVPGSGGYAEITIGGPYAYVPKAPKWVTELLPEGDRQRDHRLIWQWSELLDGTPTDALRGTLQVGHTKGDRVHDVDSGLWYEVRTTFDYDRVAKVRGVVLVLLDRDDLGGA